MRMALNERTALANGIWPHAGMSMVFSCAHAAGIRVCHRLAALPTRSGQPAAVFWYHAVKESERTALLLKWPSALIIFTAKRWIFASGNVRYGAGSGQSAFGQNMVGPAFSRSSLRKSLVFR